MLAIKSVSCCSGYSFVGYTLSCQTCFVTAQPLPQHSSTWTRVGGPRSWVCTRLTLHQQKFHSKHIWAEQSASTSLMSNGKKWKKRKLLKIAWFGEKIDQKTFRKFYPPPKKIYIFLWKTNKKWLEFSELIRPLLMYKYWRQTGWLSLIFVFV